MVVQPLIIDGRNIFSPEEIREHGFRYIGIGLIAGFKERNKAKQAEGGIALRKVPFDVVLVWGTWGFLGPATGGSARR